MINKTKNKRNLRILKPAGLIVGIVLVAYILLLIFAPQHLQRWGSFLSHQTGLAEIVIATAEPSGHYYRLGQLIKKEMQKQQGQKLKVRVTGGSLENIKLIKNREVDFALVQGGLREDVKINFKGLAAVATIGWQYVHLLVPRDSPVREFKDLAGKTLSLGSGKSGNAVLGRLVLDYFPAHFNIRTVYTEVATAGQDFHSGKMDALFTVYDLRAPVLENLLETGQYRLVPIPEAEAIAYTIPGCFSAALPHSIYGPHRDIPPRDLESFATLKVNTLLITHREMNHYVIGNLLQTLYSTQFIKQSRLPDLNEEKGRKVFDLPLHPAAARFYHRNDPITADKYEIGSAFLASLLFIASIVGYFINRYKSRQLKLRRNNIIPYFEELLGYSNKMAAVEDIEQLKNLLEQMMAMQRRAEKEWLEGKLDTEHMENLYAIYGIRCENAFHKMTLLQLIKNYSLLEKNKRDSA
ncbi:MAG: TAXI family TRAP transporter solute-binding subunit [Candidatus Aminicenantes bacterium]|jgi:TRAP transporter TAXI family solute receptor